MDSHDAIREVGTHTQNILPEPSVTGSSDRVSPRHGRAEAWIQFNRKIVLEAVCFAYLGLGETEQAFAWFEQAYKEQSNILQFLKVHPFFDAVRGDPRFTDLVRRVGLA